MSSPQPGNRDEQEVAAVRQWMLDRSDVPEGLCSDPMCWYTLPLVDGLVVAHSGAGTLETCEGGGRPPLTAAATDQPRSLSQERRLAVQQGAQAGPDFDGGNLTDDEYRRFSASIAEQRGAGGDADERRAFPFAPADCEHGSWSQSGTTWTCQLCGQQERQPLADIHYESSLEPREGLLHAARGWILRHSSQPDGDRWREDPKHLDWAAENLLCDLEPWLVKDSEPEPAPSAGQNTGQLRDELAQEVDRHRDVFDLVEQDEADPLSGRFRHACTCGTVFGTYTERESIARIASGQSRAERLTHLAAALLAGPLARLIAERDRALAAFDRMNTQRVQTEADLIRERDEARAQVQKVREVLGNVDDDTDGGSAENDYATGMDETASRVRRALDGP